jgi:hypothetical protein
MLKALPVALYATDPQGCLTYFNQAAVALAGGTPALGTDRWSVAVASGAVIIAATAS